MAYFDCYLIPVSADRMAEYRLFSTAIAAIYRQHGALRVVDALLDPETGNGFDFHAEGARSSLEGAALRDFPQAAALQDGERVVFSWTEWPDKATRDAALPRVLADPRVQPRAGQAPIFEGARLIAGGFRTLVDI